MWYCAFCHNPVSDHEVEAVKAAKAQARPTHLEQKQAQVYLLEGSISNARQCVGVRKRVFEYAAKHLAFHPVSEVEAGIVFNRDEDSRDNTLYVRLMFESKDNALRCYQKLEAIGTEPLGLPEAARCYAREHR
eukprot:PhM_4_TR18830/c1_g1_i2/m.39785